MVQKRSIGIAVVLAMVALAAFGQAKVALKGAPAPFDGKKQLHFALVRQMVEGEFRPGPSARLHFSASSSPCSVRTWTTRPRPTSSTRPSR